MVGLLNLFEAIAKDAKNRKAQSPILRRSPQMGPIPMDLLASHHLPSAHRMTASPRHEHRLTACVRRKVCIRLTCRPSNQQLHETSLQIQNSTLSSLTMMKTMITSVDKLLPIVVQADRHVSIASCRHVSTCPTTLITPRLLTYTVKLQTPFSPNLTGKAMASLHLEVRHLRRSTRTYLSTHLALKSRMANTQSRVSPNSELTEGVATGAYLIAE